MEVLNFPPFRSEPWRSFPASQALVLFFIAMEWAPPPSKPDDLIFFFPRSRLPRYHDLFPPPLVQASTTPPFTFLGIALQPWPFSKETSH